MRIGMKPIQPQTCNYPPFGQHMQGRNNGIGICMPIQPTMPAINSCNSAITNALVMSAGSSTKMFPNMRINHNLRRLKNQATRSNQYQGVQICRICGELPQTRYKQNTTLKQWICCCFLFVIFLGIPFCCYIPFYISSCYSQKQYYLKCKCGIWK
ncbi:unnamed protein product [Moneuplotes crassus]|uniref:LITAF domain-containing protein n=1 Tax=Euplotes crassus TaxID=5936 RepID=A0AAD2D0H5_EUPCR|nr:unnamed protein product [Moneuplotes crassus]